jgi:Ni,Fe-hydrogenase III small subunit/formate hydrogenlyase subunit 6/NADH:ubiquinone oxidoreductase subunit I
MFKILEKTFRAGIVTVSYPQEPARVSEHFRGRPAFDFAKWHDARPAAEICPTGAITVDDEGAQQQVAVDYGRCIFCGQCAEVSMDGAVTITQEFEMATRDRRDLVLTSYSIPNRAGQQGVGDSLRTRIHDVLGRSLAIRQVDAGSCNGCELEINALNNPVHDIERFGIHFVASPRHADMLLVTGPVTRNMELALRKTYDATPKPKVVVAVGACGISGGIFGVNYATRGGVDQVIPVDVFIPGCPPRPEALLHGILLAVDRLA